MTDEQNPFNEVDEMEEEMDAANSRNNGRRYFSWAIRKEDQQHVFIDAKNMTELNEVFEKQSLTPIKIIRGKEVAFKEKTVIQTI